MWLVPSRSRTQGVHWTPATEAGNPIHPSPPLGRGGLPLALRSPPCCVDYDHTQRERLSSWGTGSICLKRGRASAHALKWDASFWEGSPASYPTAQQITEHSTLNGPHSYRGRQSFQVPGDTTEK